VLELILFGALPYVSMALFLLVSIQRYRRDPFTFSSLSSQFLESRRLFWGSVPFHVGIIVLFFGHLTGFLIPREVLMWNSMPARRFVLEASALAAALLVAVGLIALVARRLSSDRLRPLTSAADVFVYLALGFQLVTGLWVAIGYRWGSAWYAAAAVPYLRSVFSFEPNLQIVAGLPWVAKLHIAGAWVLFAGFSFTRLVHVLVAPVPYLWRPLQVVIWNRPRGAARTP